MCSPELSNCGQSTDMAATAPRRHDSSLRILLVAFEPVSAYRWNSDDPNVLLHYLVVLLLSLSNQGPLGVIESLGVPGLISACWKFRPVSSHLVLVVVMLH